MGRRASFKTRVASCSGGAGVVGTQVLAKILAALRARLRGSCEAPGKAIRIFKDYVLDLYFPANRLSWRERLQCAPLLVLVEYMVYRVDAVTEGAKGVDLDVTRDQDYVKLHAYKAKFEALLRRANAYNQSVALQLESGEQYVRLENKVTSNQVVDHAEVMRLTELRPSDVRLLHSMIFAILRRPCDDDLLKLMYPVEVLADIGNDLAHYRQDLADGQFNTYAMFVALYGREAPERIRAEIAHYEQLFRAELAKFPRTRQGKLEAVCVRRYRSLTAMIPEALPQPGYMAARNEEMP